MPKSPNYSAPALEKGLDILEALASPSAPRYLSDLARRLDRSSSELFRMLNCLEKRGYVVRDEATGGYSLSLKLYELAHTHSPVEKLIAAAGPPMRELTAAVRESCHLGVLSHGQLVVLAQVEGPKPVRLSVEVGGRFALLHTVSGRLLLAHLPPDDQQAVLAHDPDFRRLGSQARKALLVSLSEIRRSGRSLASNESHMGVRDAAVLVGNPRAGIAAALAVCYLAHPGERDRTGEILAALRRGAKQINQSIGLTP